MTIRIGERVRIHQIMDLGQIGPAIMGEAKSQQITSQGSWTTYLLDDGREVEFIDDKTLVFSAEPIEDVIAEWKRESPNRELP